MGKAQSKRSVDITTENKKVAEEGVVEKLEKIEDVDQKILNGDATLQEKTKLEGQESNEAENDKDMTTEKSAETTEQASDENLEQNEPATGAASSETRQTSDAAAVAEEISPLSDDSIKKTKKEKVKKKWSFRSISFGKKDKQKPAKSEESAENIAALTNGEKAATAENETDTSKKDEPVADDVKPADEKVSDAAIEEEKKEVEQISTAVEEKEEEEEKEKEKDLNEDANKMITSSNTTASTNETGMEIANDKDVVPSVEAIESVTPVQTANANDSEVVMDLDTDKPSLDNVMETKSEAIIENKEAIPAEVATNGDAEMENLHQNGIKEEEHDAQIGDDQSKVQVEEMDNAKDLKENAAAVTEIIQDISVTCE